MAEHPLAASQRLIDQAAENMEQCRLEYQRRGDTLNACWIENALTSLSNSAWILKSLMAATSGEGQFDG